MAACTAVREALPVTAHESPVERWTLRSPSGVQASVLSFGAVLQSLRVPDAAGTAVDDIVLRLAGPREYAGHGSYLGAVVGRYANRIAGGTFHLDGVVHRVPANDRGNALHGGPDGFDQRVWQASPVPCADGSTGVRMTLDSPDGDQGFPGRLTATVDYVLRTDGTLVIDYSARTDRPTVANLTHHAYFNLTGRPEKGVLGHVLTVDADTYLPIDDTAIPLPGAPEPVRGTPFDFTGPQTLGGRIGTPHPQLATAGGYDHCWVLRGHAASHAPDARENAPTRPLVPHRAARLEEPRSGRVMEVRTTEPGLQVYSGQQLDGTLRDAEGRPLTPHAGVCLETQHFPDSPNRPDYPSTVLRPDRPLRSRTEFSFPHLRACG
ncbi:MULTISPECIES: aldose epimerase family protein [Streptomycetaceae]|uniref:Aldose 1-epimerase n=1 Tax=Streptantibioticus cattleyicolor (strain ATCC 35852 / DSM 46488 / JCM 4925 / NBRC 14057 / NRRL 8057) TaxID=1003195 RepID=F8K327_STREN|nr:MULTISPECIES: aldose epimerase family protein [Streptomycetaceae]AEW92522.1 Aldose 1-epimerase [Streptantibioticus cattleyicolor NRRL 8057 = DSM 46488]MYS57319.1 galactose-1-epimerase [Streptomyces sp. SID5468]CCB72882.1 Aldose 1-epimerase [Streptantibioticus cattleyicolor NRRL 8057 = DSM 46488]